MKVNELDTRECGFLGCGDSRCEPVCKGIPLWDIRTSSSGAFPEAKASGDLFRGSRRED